MTKEDIDIQAHLYEDSCHNPSIQRHFTDGAEWMKEKIIEKACKAYCNVCYNRQTGCELLCRDRVIFRKAMEE